MNSPLRILTGVAAAMPMENIDTDVIWPVTTRISMLRGKQADNAFARLRFDEAWDERPAFVLNQEPWRDARILIAGRNFGCGSSREMAVWALHEWGLRVIIAPSFGDIFFNNACLNGLLPVRLPHDIVRRLMNRAADPARCKMTVDLEAFIVTAGDIVAPFELDAHRRHLLLDGLDEVSFTLKQRDRLTDFAADYAQRYPWSRVRPLIPTGD